LEGLRFEGVEFGLKGIAGRSVVGDGRGGLEEGYFVGG